MTFTERIDAVSKVVLDTHRGIEDVIAADVNLTHAVADIEKLLDLKMVEISSRPENVGIGAAMLKILWKNETIDERRLFTIGKGLKSTLKNIEYNMYK